MKRLPLTVPLGHREAPSDFLSRLAVRNCVRDMRTLAHDLLLDVQGVICGESAALVRLAEAGAADLAALEREAFCGSPRSISIFHRGHKFSRTIQLTRNQVRICPACFREDLDAHSFQAEVRPYRRAHWMISQIKTCERHQLALVPLGGMAAACESLDTSLIIARSLRMLPQIEAQAVERPLTSFERYVLERLDQPAGDGWINGLKLHVVMQSAALLGASMTRGHLTRLSDLSDDERRESDNIGFEAVSQGESGIRAALDAMKTEKTGGNATGPTAMYGQIYYWLANANAEEDFDPIRKIIADHIADTMPIGPGDKLFGMDVPKRKIHSIWSASRQYRMDRDRLRLMLIEKGWIPPRSDLTFNWQTFDAIKSEQFLKDAKSSLNYLQALKYLNAPKAHEPILVASGLLKPWIAAGSSGLKDHAFLPRDLDAFLVQLTRAADERYSDDPALMNISAAQKRVFCGAEAIVRLIVEGKLQRVGKRIGVDGYNSVLVDPREVEALILTRDQSLLSVKEAAAIMRAPVNSVHALVDQKILPAVNGRHPKTNRPMKTVSRSAVEQFLSSYIPLAEAAKFAGVSWGTFRKRQNSRGVAAAFDNPGVFYRREDLKDQIP